MLRQCPFGHMTRILSPNLFRRLFDTSPPSRLSVFAPKFCRKLTSDRTNMDLSDMRKKYKGDAEVSCAVICHTVSCLCHCVVVKTVQYEYCSVAVLSTAGEARVHLSSQRCLRPDHDQFRSNKTSD